MKKIHIVLFSLFLFACASKIDRTPGQAYHFYDQEAFIELSTTTSLLSNPDSSYLSKWNKQIRIKIEGNTKPEDMQVVVGVVRDLSSFLPIDVAFVNDKPNFVIFFGTAREIQQITQGRLLREKAFSVRKPDKSKNIFAFQSFLSDSLEDQEERRKALVCSVVAGVGFLSDTRRFSKGCFAHFYNDDVFNEHDREMLKLLYRPEFKSGMTSKEIREVFKTIIRPL